MMVRGIQKIRNLVRLIRNIRGRQHILIDTAKTVHVRMEAKGVHRYLLALHQLAEEAGRPLHIHTTPASILRAHNFNWSRYHMDLYREGHLRFDAAPEGSCELSIDYFAEDDRYRIPIGPHPNFSAPHPLRIEEETVPNSIGFYGSRISKYATFNSNFWDMPSRLDTLDLLRPSFPDIASYFHSMEAYTNALVRCDYFICLPGVHMPLCHNLYEAILCGSVPVLHQRYARWLNPDLQQLLKPVTYANDEELLVWVLKIQSGEFQVDSRSLASELKSHCDASLSWEGIRKHLEQSNSALICAEEESVKLAFQSRSV